MKKAAFANIIIAACVAASLGITAAVAYEDTVLTSGVVTALLGLWGGELLIIALRQIFGSDIMSRAGSSRSGGGNNGPSI